MWYNEVSGRTFVYYDDGSSQQWVEFGVPPNGSKIALASYADSAARTTAIPSPTEADLSYLQDTNSVEVYDGSAWGALAGGKILQVVSTFIPGTFSTASTSFVDITGHTATITPSSASNKVLVLYTTHTAPAAGRVALLNLVRDGSTIAQPTGGVNPSTAQFYGTHEIANVNFNYLDSPASTSAVVYKIQTMTDTGTMYVNRNATNILTAISSLTLLEVSA